MEDADNIDSRLCGSVEYGIGEVRQWSASDASQFWVRRRPKRANVREGTKTREGGFSFIKKAMAQCRAAFFS